MAGAREGLSGLRTAGSYLNTNAFVGTNTTDEQITSGLPVIRLESGINDPGGLTTSVGAGFIARVAQRLSQFPN